MILQYDFTGRKDLVKFLKLVGEAGLYVHLRIGPYVCAEWNYGYISMHLNLFVLPWWFCRSISIAYHETGRSFAYDLMVYITVGSLFGCILSPGFSFERTTSRTRFLSFFFPFPFFDIWGIFTSFSFYISTLLFINVNWCMDICCFRRKWNDSWPRLWTWWSKKICMHPKEDPLFCLRYCWENMIQSKCLFLKGMVWFCFEEFNESLMADRKRIWQHWLGVWSESQKLHWMGSRIGYIHERWGSMGNVSAK